MTYDWDLVGYVGGSLGYTLDLSRKLQKTKMSGSHKTAEQIYKLFKRRNVSQGF